MKKLKSLRIPIYYVAGISLMFLLIIYQVFQTRQHATAAMHFQGTTKKSYRENFLRIRPTGPSWNMLEIPDSQLARKGIYITYPTSGDKEAWRIMDREDAFRTITEELEGDKTLKRQIKRYAKREEISLELAMTNVVTRIYEERSE